VSKRGFAPLKNLPSLKRRVLKTSHRKESPPLERGIKGDLKSLSISLYERERFSLGPEGE
jgi:hypothetical protein